jgi:hypothetical protein
VVGRGGGASVSSTVSATSVRPATGEARPREGRDKGVGSSDNKEKAS